MGSVRLLVAAPHPLLREGVRMSLEGSGIEFCAEARDLRTAVGGAAVASPDVCLVDADLPGGGLATVQAILSARPLTAVIVIADRSSEADLLASVRAGAIGYLDKDIDTASLPFAIRAALAGEAVVPRRLVGQLISEVRAVSSGAIVGVQLPSLTRREREVLGLLSSGMSTVGIADRLFVSPGTVRSHVMSLMHKLHVGSRDALVQCSAAPIPRPRAVAH